MPRTANESVSRLLRYGKRHRAGAAISLSACFVSLGLYTSLYLSARPSPLLEFLADIEFKTLDVRFLLRGPRRPRQPVVIVAIDQKTEDAFGRWPFPRSHFAEMVNVLNEAQARVVVFDVNFPQPDQNSAFVALRQVIRKYETAAPASSEDPRFLNQLKTLELEADNDRKFAEALSHSGNAILGYFFLTKREAQTENQERVSEFLNYLSFQAYPQVVHSEFGKVFEGPEAEGLSPNLPSFARYAKNFGYFNVIPDADGTVRREPVVIRFQGNYYPSLDVASALAYTGRSLDQVAVVFNRNGLDHVDLGSVVILPDPGGYVQIDFCGPVGTFPTYSLADVVQRKLPKDFFRDRLVLVGPTATGIADMAVTPFQEMGFPGVEVHANFIENLLEGRFIRRGLRENLVDIVFILLFSLGAGVLLNAARPVTATAVLVVGLGFYLWLAYYLFARHRIWIAAFLPTATLGVNYAGIISCRFFFEEREKKKVRGVFGQYVSPGVINQLLARPELVRLGGEEKEITAMFSDIRGFTTIAEGLSPSALVDLLNEYFSEMTEVVFRHWGTLDKYIGDALMAFWGAPFPQVDHAERACLTALDMLGSLHELHTRWRAEGKPDFEITIGVNTGPMLVGNLGSSRRFNFTIMGDNVNLASRLQGLNKEFRTRLIVSESTYRAAQDKLAARELDLIRVKGKTKPVKIYEVLGRAEELPRFKELFKRFQEGLEAYRSARWETGVKHFEAMLSELGDDGPTRVFLKRCRNLVERPPKTDWDGVYVMETK